MAIRKSDDKGLPLSSKIWLRHTFDDCIIVRNDGKASAKEIRIHSYALKNTINNNAGEKCYSKFGTTPGGRRYEIRKTIKPDGSVFRVIEVLDLNVSHVKIRYSNKQTFKIDRKLHGGCLTHWEDMGDFIKKSFTMPKIKV